MSVCLSVNSVCNRNPTDKPPERKSYEPIISALPLFLALVSNPNVRQYFTACLPMGLRKNTLRHKNTTRV